MFSVAVCRDHVFHIYHVTFGSFEIMSEDSSIRQEFLIIYVKRNNEKNAKTNRRASILNSMMAVTWLRGAWWGIRKVREGWRQAAGERTRAEGGSRRGQTKALQVKSEVQ
jgi:hypothetical protein